MPDFVAGTRVAPTMVAGTRGPENQNAARVVVDIGDEIFMFMPSASAFTTLTAKTRKKRVTHNQRFDWLEKDEMPRSVELVADSIVGDTVIDVIAGQGARIAKHYVLQNTRTMEQVLCTATPAADAITVVRGIGGSEVDMVIGDTLVFTRAVYPDGSDIGDKKSIKEEAYYNFTEIIRTPFGFTGRDLVTELYGGGDKMTETKWQAIEHARSIENAMFFGRRHERTGDNNHKQTFTGGLDYWITTNRWDVTGVTLNPRALVEVLEEVMKWGRGGYLNGSSTKYLFTSARWATEIGGWFRDKVEYKTHDKVAGLNIGEYISEHGRIMFVRAPILDVHHPDMAFLLDLNHVRYAYMKTRDTKLQENREGNGIDGEDYEYMTDCGLQVELESSHAIFSGLA